ncbi:S-adenosyl-L-methionine-dependent methyltransferase [Mycena venus]|uniref:S-adenosyl-L-methionine-dependent methyltransferase n=1 Tax=Mycena venus TaxID=2733690 RepID=A0A8H6XMK7_9AGAR|nr:S-adenosyl-L-methionine-dependent methyltransferase [Mycena venus]
MIFSWVKTAKPPSMKRESSKNSWESSWESSSAAQMPKIGIEARNRSEVNSPRLTTLLDRLFFIRATTSPAKQIMTTTLENPKSHIEHGYDVVADKYLAWSSARPTTTRMKYIADLVEKLPTGADVLELGCGAGVPATQVLIEHGLKVTGNDISAAQIALARKHVPEATLIQGDMLALDFAPGSFDAVLGFYSIFHLPKDEQVLLIEKIRGWLRPGGWLLCNLQFEEGDVTRHGWFEPEVIMFASGLGVEGTRDIFRKKVLGFKLVVDEVDIELVGGTEERFHWIMALKEDASAD